MNFSEKVKSLREGVGLSRLQLAQKLSMTERAIYNYEVHDQRPKSKDNLQKLAEILGVDVGYLLCESDILQFMEDDSDREFERFIAGNMAAKWFCGFSLTEDTPDFTTLCKFRNAIGTKQMANLFQEVKRQMMAKGCCSEVFTFVDSSALISKLSLWEERDKAIAQGYKPPAVP